MRNYKGCNLRAIGRKEKTKPINPKNWTPIMLAQLAGLVEMGSARIHRSLTTRKPNYQPIIRIGSNSKVIMEWLYQNFSGTYLDIYDTRKDSYSSYAWESRGVAATILLHHCGPYLIAKKEHAFIFSLYGLTIPRTRPCKGRPTLTEEVLEYRAFLYNLLQNLNQKTQIEDRRSLRIPQELVSASKKIGLFDIEFEGNEAFTKSDNKGFFDSFIEHLENKQ